MKLVLHQGFGEVSVLLKVATRREFAPGIPMERRIDPIPQITKEGPDEDWQMSLSLHPAAKRGDHLDLRLVDGNGRAHSWAMNNLELPKPGAGAYAIQMPTHSGKYALRKKPFSIPQGVYGGTRPGAKVTPLILQKTKVLNAGDDRIQFQREHEGGMDEFVLRRIGEGPKPVWTLQNVTRPAELEKSGGEIVRTTPARLKTTLLPHQQRVVDRMKQQPGLVVAHGLGTGKTLSSIAAGVNLHPDRIQVIVPAALKDNYLKELRTHVEGDLPVEIESLQRAATRDALPASDLLIVDEAHRARNPKSKSYAILRGAPAEKRMLLTASPVYNKPEDLASLINLAAGGKALPEGNEFAKRYVKKPKDSWTSLLPWVDANPKIIRKNELGPVLSTWVDVHKEEGGDFPQRVDERVAVPMSKRQTKLHQAAWGSLPLLTRLRMEKGMPPRKKDLSVLNKFESQARQISNSEQPFTVGEAPLVPKLQEAVQRFDQQNAINPAHKALVYSNFLPSLNEYGEQLEQRGVPFARFTGQESRKVRQQAVSDYNAGKLKALLVSSAGGEGLDLKGTRQVQVLEPHWNDEKLNQVIGRAIRHGSHAGLPKDQRSVRVERYETYPTGLLGGRKTGVEQYLNDMSDQKERLNTELLRLIKTPS